MSSTKLKADWSTKLVKGELYVCKARLAIIRCVCASWGGAGKFEFFQRDVGLLHEFWLGDDELRMLVHLTNEMEVLAWTMRLQEQRAENSRRRGGGV